MKVDLLLTGRIASLAGDSGFGWIEAIAIADGRVVLSGDRRTVEGEVTAARRRIELPPDLTAIPGLTDAHLHMADFALAAEEVDLGSAATLHEALPLIAAAHRALPPDAWLEGHGWDASRWGEWPTAEALTAVAPGRKVALWQHDHHALWASREALAAAGIVDSTPDPQGGLIRRDAAGRATGTLNEAAASLVLGIVPPPPPERIDAAMIRAGRELLALGVVAVQDPGEVSADVTLEGGFACYLRLGENGTLPLRIHASVRSDSLELAIANGYRSGERLGGAHSRAKVGWLKVFGDGTVGARTARMLAPYESEPDRGDPPGGPLGVAVTEPAEMLRLVRRAAEGGIATQIHAIGDQANRSAIEALRTMPRAAVGGLRPRIEHAQLVEPGDVPAMAAAGIVAAVMPKDIRADEVNAYRSWGRSRVEAGAYAYGLLARHGVTLALATDAPVESPDPWPQLASAVTRRDPSWPPTHESFGAAHALPLDQALRAACLGAAIAAGEADRGRLTVGSLADVAVIPSVALDEPVRADGPLETTRPVMTLLDGEVVFER